MDTISSTASAYSGKFSSRIVLGLILAGAILVAISGLMFRSITQLLNSEGWVAHSYQVLDALDLTEAFFVDAQSAERGYVATCNPNVLSPFRRDLPQIFAHVATLRSLTADNPAQQARVDSLGKMLSAELERMSGVINTNLNGHQLQAETMLTDQRDVSGTRAISTLLNAMETDERALLADRLHNVTLFAWATLISCTVGAVLICAILAFVFWLIRREIRRRERTEHSFQLSNEKLEESLKDLHRYNKAAHAVGLLGELLHTCRNQEEALSIAAHHLRDVLPDAAGAIALFSNSRDDIEVVQSFGDGALFSPRYRPDACWGLRRGRVHQAGPDGFEPHCAHLEAPRMHLLCVPMIAQGDTLGVLSLAHGAGLADFERQTVQTVAEQLSLALANLKTQEGLRNQSLRDPLTGLFNRRYMDETLVREIARAARENIPLSVAMVDIDHFKRFNDTYGHEGGDVLLGAFGKLLVKHARSEDIVCRYGGEEFVIILPGADLGVAAARLDHIRAAVKAMHVQSRGQPLGHVSMSAGVALFPPGVTDGGTILAAADQALYEAKRAGRDRVACAGPAHAVAQTG